MRATRTDAIFIEGRRSAYSPEQIYSYCGGTMTVGELINFLSDFDADTPIMLRNDGGYTYGEIDCYSFEYVDNAIDEDELNRGL